MITFICISILLAIAMGVIAFSVEGWHSRMLRHREATLELQMKADAQSHKHYLEIADRDTPADPLMLQARIAEAEAAKATADLEDRKLALRNRHC